jgi:hypothetical protein
MELSTAPAVPVRFEVDRSAGGASARPPLWIRNVLRRVT